MTPSRSKPDQPQKRVVDEGVVAVGVDVDDRLGNVVGEQPQLLLARRQRLLGELEIVDVVLGAIQAAYRAGGIEVGRDAAVHPPPLPVRADADALVVDVLAFLRALDDRAQERVDVVRHDLVGRLAVDLVLRAAHPVGERLVDEGVLEFPVEIGDRAGNVVGEQPQLRFLRLQRLADADVVLDIVDHRRTRRRSCHPARDPGTA